MDENKLFELVKNDAFLDQLLDSSSREEMRQILESTGQNISEEELDYLITTIEKAIQTSSDVCSDESMDIVAGGTDYHPVEDHILRRTMFKTENARFNPDLNNK